MGVFAFGASGFKNNANNTPTLQSDYCMNLQHDAFAFHYNNGATSDDAWTESIIVYERCERQRGNF